MGNVSSSRAISSEKPLNIGDYVKIRIIDTLDYDLLGEVCDDESAE